MVQGKTELLNTFLQSSQREVMNINQSIKNWIVV